jgi:putative tricarboxylic transport membrane protein
MRLGRDGIAGLVCLAISLLLLPQAVGLPKLPIVPIGPGFYPIIVLVFMALASAILLLQDALAQRRAGPSVGDEQAAQPRRAYGLVAAAFAIVAAYIALLPLLGFRIATALFVIAFQMALERPTTLRQWAVLMAIALGTSAVTYAVFNHYLLVLLPRGAWTGW